MYINATSRDPVARIIVHRRNFHIPKCYDEIIAM